MNPHVILIALAAAALGAGANAGPPSEASFDWVEYRSLDPAPAAGAGEYRNPVIAGFYPDPSVTRVGDDFYLVNSTFSWFPGIPVFHSRDLVSWRQVGNAIDRAGQLDFTGLGMSAGVFAPDISHHDGRFFLVNTCVGCGGNYVLTATSAAGPWSDPVWLREVDGIDPSLFFDEDGRAWIVNCGPPPGKPRYEGHTAIWIQRFDPVALKTFGPRKVLVDGGVDPAANPVWVEGPHLFRHAGRYYLTAAEGGTETRHSQVIFRSDAVDGPYEPGPRQVNPILTQRDLDPNRAGPITSAGHADLIELPGGAWWAVFLATRPYEGDLYNTGRETFLLPVSWTDGWPTILPKGRAIPAVAARPRLATQRAAVQPAAGGASWREGFDGVRLPLAWITMRTPKTRWWSLASGRLRLQARTEGIGDRGQPSFLAVRQRDMAAEVSTSLQFQPADGAAAGLAAVQDDDHFLAIQLTRHAEGRTVEVVRKDDKADPARGRVVASRVLGSGTGALRLRITANGGRYSFAYADGREWRTLAADIDGTNLSTRKAGGFTGAMIGVFAQAAPPSGEPRP